MRNFLLAAIVMGCITGADEPKKADAKKEAEAFQGTWKMASVIRNGEDIPAAYIATGELVVSGEIYKVTLGEISASATFKLDPNKSPKQIDLSYFDGPTNGQTLLGIYELNGDEMKVCRALDAKTDRPTKFAAPADSGLISVVWKKTKKEVEKPLAKTAPMPKAKSEPLPDKPLTAADAKEIKDFEGTWLFESLVMSGNNVPIEGLKGSTLILKGRNWEMNDPSGLSKGTFRFDLTSKPKKLDLLFENGPQAGATIQAIYELDGDTYKVCVSLTPGDRPTEFVSKKGSFHALEVLKREKN